MGNLHSAHIECLIEKQSDLQPGESLKGVVKLTVHDQGIVQQSFDGISIVVAGVEYISVDDNTVVPTSKVIKVRSIIDINENELTKGIHEFPFDIALPTYEEHREHYRSQNPGQDQEQQIPGLRSLYASDDSSMSESEFSVSPMTTLSKVFLPTLHEVDGDDGSVQDERKTIIYHAKAVMKRKKNVQLTTDTDIKCHAQCIASSSSSSN
jgi:hypothetical protein